LEKPDWKIYVLLPKIYGVKFFGTVNTSSNLNLALLVLLWVLSMVCYKRGAHRHQS